GSPPKNRGSSTSISPFAASAAHSPGRAPGRCRSPPAGGGARRASQTDPLHTASCPGACRGCRRRRSARRRPGGLPSLPPRRGRDLARAPPRVRDRDPVRLFAERERFAGRRADLFWLGAAGDRSAEDESGADVHSCRPPVSVGVHQTLLGRSRRDGDPARVTWINFARSVSTLVFNTLPPSPRIAWRITSMSPSLSRTNKTDVPGFI